MKRPLLLLAGCLAPMALSADAAARSPIVRSAPEVQDQEQSDVATLRRAARILRSKGHVKESQRLVEIAAEMKPRAKPEPARRGEARAKRLLNADIQDKAVRVKMLEFAADCYKRAGDKPNAEAMAWFAAIGKSQLAGNDTMTEPVPEAAMAGDGNIMQRLTEIVRSGAPAQERMGNGEAARLHLALADFYERRSRGEGTAVEPTPPTRENDLSYIEGRLPALRVAERAYALDLPMRAEVRKQGAQRMAWMVALARLRVEGEGEAAVTPPPPGSGPINMDALIDCIRAAGELHAKAGDRRAAKRCFDLAEYYKLRKAGVAVDNSSQSRLDEPLRGLGYAGDDPSDEKAEVNARRRALEMRRMELEKRIAEVRMRLEEAKAELEAIRAGGGR